MRDVFSYEEMEFRIVYDFPVCPQCLSKMVTHSRVQHGKGFVWRFYCVCKFELRRELVIQADQGVGVIDDGRRAIDVTPMADAGRAGMAADFDAVSNDDGVPPGYHDDDLS